MVVIYDQNKTFIKNSLEDAQEIIMCLYGEKLGREAISALQNSLIGSTWRRNGGPLIKIVDKEKAKWIEAKEAKIGML